MVVDDTVLLRLTPEHGRHRINLLPWRLPDSAQCELALHGFNPKKVERPGLLVGVGYVEIGGQNQSKPRGGQKRLQRLILPVQRPGRGSGKPEVYPI